MYFYFIYLFLSITVTNASDYSYFMLTHAIYVWNVYSNIHLVFLLFLVSSMPLRAIFIFCFLKVISSLFD
jgi:hypothetical protein